MKASRDCSKEVGCFPRDTSWYLIIDKASPTTVCGSPHPVTLPPPITQWKKLQNWPHPYQSHRSLGSRTTNLSKHNSPVITTTQYGRVRYASIALAVWFHSLLLYAGSKCTMNHRYLKLQGIPIKISKDQKRPPLKSTNNLGRDTPPISLGREIQLSVG